MAYRVDFRKGLAGTPLAGAPPPAENNSHEPAPPESDSPARTPSPRILPPPQPFGEGIDPPRLVVDKSNALDPRIALPEIAQHFVSVRVGGKNRPAWRHGRGGDIPCSTISSSAADRAGPPLPGRLPGPKSGGPGHFPPCSPPREWRFWDREFCAADGAESARSRKCPKRPARCGADLPSSSRWNPPPSGKNSTGRNETGSPPFPENQRGCPGRRPPVARRTPR